MMTNALRRLTLTVALAPLAVSAALADEGMWLVNRPPLQQLKSTYKFEPSAEWLEHLQKSCVRFSSGGSGSIVSADGLVMTNHHVGSDNIEKLSTPQRDLMETGFYAATRSEELPCNDLELRVLWTIEDVTDRVEGAAAAAQSASDANEARRKMMATIEDESKARTGLDHEVVTLYRGAQYHLYGYKRYTDIRLVFAPESDIAFFGGDTDNFEYPRHCLDVCFFRIYENDQPLKSEHHLKWSSAGAKESDLAIVCGHPAATTRIHTVEHLTFLRDVDTPFILRNLWRREVKLASFRDRSAENARIGSGDFFGVQNSRKAITGELAALHDPELMDRKRKAEAALRAAIESDREHESKWIGAWNDIGDAFDAYKSFHLRYQLLEVRRSGLRSDLFNIARHLVRLAHEKPKPSGERLREYRDSELQTLHLELFSPAPVYEALEIDRLASGLSLLAELLGVDDPAVKTALNGQSPHERARTLVRGSSLKDVEARKQLEAGGAQAIAQSSDPLIRLAADLDAEARALRKRYENEVEAVEREAYAKIAAAQFAAYGEGLYPDATFTLRLSFGPIKGYNQDGQRIAPFTTLGGAFKRMEERTHDDQFQLTPRWLERKASLNLDTPYNFVCTADITGGNSGSPVVSTQGEVIGLIFDGNIQSLAWDMAYSDEQGRAIAVDSRAIIECLRKLYHAGALADEITRN